MKIPSRSLVPVCYFLWMGILKEQKQKKKEVHLSTGQAYRMYAYISSGLVFQVWLFTDTISWQKGKS